MPAAEDDEAEGRRQQHRLEQEHQQQPGGVRRPARDGQVRRQPDDDRNAQADQGEPRHGRCHDQQPDADDLAVHRDGAQAVGHQRHEVHCRLAAEPPGPAGGDRAPGLPRLDDRRGVVVPQLRDRHQARQPPPGHGAEVADPHPLANQQDVQQLVERVEDVEAPRLRPPRPLGEDDRAALLLAEPGQQPRHVLGGILAVAVHDDHRLARQAALDVGQADGDRPLMAQVPPQPEHVDPPHRAEAPAHNSIGRRPDRRAIVDDQHVGPEPVLAQDDVQAIDQLGEGGPVVEQRDEDDDRPVRLAARVMCHGTRPVPRPPSRAKPTPRVGSPVAHA